MSSWQRKSLLALGITGVLVAIGGFATLFTVYVQGSISDPGEVLQVAATELAAGRFRIAERLAESVEVDPEAESELYYAREYLLGASRVEMALQEPDIRRRRLALRVALPTLQTAAEHGVLEDMRGRLGNSLLGTAAFDLGEFDTANERLTRALSLDPTAARRLLPLLIRSRIQSSTIPVASAVEATESLLKLPNLAPEERVAAHLLGARARMKANDWIRAGEHIAEAKKVGVNTDIVELADAELKLEQANELIRHTADQPLSRAVLRLLQDVIDTVNQVSRTGDPADVTRANYLGGQALRLMGREDAAIEVFSNVRLARDPAFIPAAGIEELELLEKNQLDDELLTSTKLIISEIGDPQVYDGTLLPIEECRQRLTSISERLMERDAYRTAIDYTRLLSPLVPPASALSIEGRSWNSWGLQSEQDAGQGAIASNRPLSTEARERFREAGRVWTAAAQLRFTEEDFPDRLWLAITALQAGGAFPKSLELLDEYLRYAPREGQPRGLVARGKALLALGKVEEALSPLLDCIDQYPTDPQRFDARLTAAQCDIELGRFAAAREHLENNLNDESLVPESPMWRDSLYALGKLLYRQSMETHLAMTAPSPTPNLPTAEQREAVMSLIDETIDRLETVDERYSDKHREIRDARYLAAQSHRMAAHWPQQEADLPDTIDTVRRELLNKRLAHLETAYKELNSVREELSRLQETTPLSEHEELILRNCYLTEADTLYDLGRYAEAQDVYAGAALRYSGEPISLEATVRQARCYVALERPEEAVRVYRQAAKNLERIPESQDPMFARTTRHTRAGWQALLAWLNKS